jgi:hypothetical protein
MSSAWPTFCGSAAGAGVADAATLLRPSTANFVILRIVDFQLILLSYRNPQ